MQQRALPAAPVRLIVFVTALFVANLYGQTVNPLTVTMGSDGGAWALNVTATTAWTATSNSFFLHILGNGAATGSATILFAADPYTGTSSRSGTLTVAGQTVTVTQNPKYLTGNPVTLVPATYGIFPNSALAGDQNHNLYFESSVPPGISRYQAGQAAPLVTTKQLTLDPVTLNGVFTVNTNATNVYWINIASNVTGSYVYNLATQIRDPIDVNNPVSAGLSAVGTGQENVYYLAQNYVMVGNGISDRLSLAGLALPVSGLNAPQALLAPNGNFPLVVADTGNSAVKIFPQNSGAGATIMSGVAAKGLARDGQGNIYALTSSAVFKWTLATQQTTQILTTTATAIWADELGDVFLIDSTGIQKFNTGAPWCTLGASYLTVGSAAGANSVSIHFAPFTPEPWTASSASSWIHLTNPTGKGPGNLLFTVDANPGTAPRSGTIGLDSGLQMVVTQAGTTYIGIQNSTTLIPSIPARGLASDYAGDLFLANYSANVIDQWSAATQQLTSSFVQTGYHTPSAVALDDSGNIYFSDTSLNTIQQWNVTTNQLSTLVSGLNQPQGIAVDHQGEIAIANQSSSVEDIWDPNFGTLSLAVPLVGAYGTATDPSGNVYFTDQTTNTVKKYSRVSKPGTITVISTGLTSPYGLSVDGYGNIYVADQGSPIKKWNAATNTLTTLVPAGVGYGTAVDGAGNVYATPGGNSVIKLTSAFVSIPPIESGAGGTDSLIVLPASTPLTGVFAPTSSQTWLTITSAANGTIGFSLAPNETGAARNALIVVLGQSIAVTQSAGTEMLANPGRLRNRPSSVRCSPTRSQSR